MNERPKSQMAVAPPLKLTLRRAALLHAIRFGSPPWLDPGDRAIGAADEVGKEWILCCGHTFGTREIEAMAQAGWITIGAKIDREGRTYRTTLAGPRIKEAWFDG